MSFLPSRPLVLAVLAVASGAIVLAGGGCGSDSPAPAADDRSDAPSGKETGSDEDGASPGDDAGTDSSTTLSDGATIDANCPKGKVLPDKGETCVGFGKGTPCDPACGLGEYGYVCFNGGPPGFAGCVQASSTGSFGDTYCCPQNKCVPQPDLDGMCTVAGKPHHYQCPPDGTDGGSITPPAGCTALGSGGSAVERFYCCP